MLFNLKSEFNSQRIPGQYVKLKCNILTMNTWKVKFISSTYTSMAASLLDSPSYLLLLIFITLCNLPDFTSVSDL